MLVVEYVYGMMEHQQIGGIQEAYMNSNGLNVTDNIICYSFNANNATITSFLYVSSGLGIGTITPWFPWHIAGYQSSYQTYKFLNYNGVGGPGGIQIIIYLLLICSLCSWIQYYIR